MPRVSQLRQLQTEWNALVPAARAAGIRRIRLLNETFETIAYRQSRLEWLRNQLGTITTLNASLDAFTFGIELEMILPRGATRGSLAIAIQDAGISCNEEMYNHHARPSWKVVTDRSLGDYSRGCELVSPIMRGEDGFAQVRKVCAVLVAQGCKVNRKCGFHVHVGARNEQPIFFKRLIKMYASAESAIDSFMAPSRRASANIFCRAIRGVAQVDAANTLNQVVGAIGQSISVRSVRSAGRYCKLNLQSLGQHGTVEFRQHQGTVEGNKVENWVKLCLRLCLAARQLDLQPRTLDELLNAVSCSETEKQYFNARAATFAPQQARRAA